jgi:uncharacterized protein YecT (DUF1311 family)
MSQLKIAAASLLIYITLSGIACQAEEMPTAKSIALPADMKGTWQVSDVLFDQADNETVRKGPGIKYSIPVYLGRIINITSRKITINSPGETACEDPKLLPQKSTAAKIVAKSIHTRVFDNAYPTPQDMGLPLADDTPVEVLYLTCGDKLSPSSLSHIIEDLGDARWFIKLGNDRLAMNWRSESILILRRLQDNAKPVASFDCAKAGTIAEKTICSDVGLAAYDKSLAQAYNLVLAYYRSRSDTKSTIAELRTFQRKWIAKRDQCGNDIVCMEKAIDDRILNLVHDLIDFWYDNYDYSVN